jgi:hypothetical protein
MPSHNTVLVADGRPITVSGPNATVEHLDFISRSSAI